jgi:hypothetical protein
MMAAMRRASSRARRCAAEAGGRTLHGLSAFPRRNFGSLAMLAAMRRASSRLSSLAAVQGTGATFSQKDKPPLTIP